MAAGGSFSTCAAKGDSEGAFRGFEQEAEDLHHTLTWLRQALGCDVNIGLYGFSCQGLTQFAGPARHGPPPSCLAPAMCGLDERGH